MKPSTNRREFLAATATATAAATASTFLPASKARAAEPIIKVVVWDERQPAQKQAYDDFLGNAIAAHLRKEPGLSVKSVGLDDPNQGLGDDVLGDARVLIWWGHVRQDKVAPEVGKRIVERIAAGTLSLIALHSAHWSTPFIEAMNERTRRDVAAKYLRGNPPDVAIHDVPPPRRSTVPKRDERLTPYVHERKYPDGKLMLDVHLPYCCFPSYRNDGKPSDVKVLKPDHPIVKGVPSSFEIPHEEMYDEPFHVPEPDEVILEERWATGEWFRSGMLWTIGKGKVFYFRPGHETYPTYRQEWPLRIVANAVSWMGTGA
jgi:trehalose utilization protein